MDACPGQGEAQMTFANPAIPGNRSSGWGAVSV